MLSTALLTHYRQVSQQLLTVVDVETTGYRPSDHRVIEVAVVQASLAHGIQHQQSHLINPQVPVPPEITCFTGITQTMVDQASEAFHVWPSYDTCLNQGVLTAHNLAFDYAFLQSELNQQGLLLRRPPTEQLCTVILARLMLPDLPSRRLPDLVEHFGFSVGPAHRAAADALACWFLAQRLLTEIANEADDVLLHRFAQQWLPLGDAAALLGCSGRQARSMLERAGVKPGGRHRTLYRRGDVERVWADQPSRSVQLSWL